MAVKKNYEHPYYTYDQVCSYNAVYNFIVGQRGNGKTYGAKAMAIRKFLRKREMFIYLRRYMPELSTRHSFFADVQHEFPDYDFRVLGIYAQCAPVETRDDKKRKWETMGYFIALTRAQHYKGLSLPDVTTIIFDEFIIEKNGVLKYLPDESAIFNNFFYTVDRGQDKTRVYFLSNSASMMNPYFIAYDIQPDISGEFETREYNGDRFIVVHFIDASRFAESVYRTRWGKFIHGSEYAAYAVENQFSDAHHELVEDKSSNAKYHYTLETSKGSFSVWYDMHENVWYVLKKRPRGNENIVTLVPENMGEGKRFVAKNDPLIGSLRTAWRYDRARFDTPGTRNIFTEVFNT